MPPTYLQSPPFLEPHDGPHVQCKCGRERPERDPSPEQIAAMCAAIRATWDANRELQALGRTGRLDDWIRRYGMAEPTHVPHGISARAFGGQGDLDIYGSPLGGGAI